MLSLILPPIIVVIALGALFLLFFRKLPDMKREEKVMARLGTNPFDSMTDRLKRFFLGLVERVVGWFKLSFLRLHNRLNAFSAVTRSARVRVAERISERTKRERQPETTSGSDVAIPKSNVEIVSESMEKKRRPITRIDGPSSSVLSRTRRGFGETVEKFRSNRFRRSSVPIRPVPNPEPPLPKERLEDLLVERISLNPRDIEAYERLGDYYLEQNNLGDAKECYRQVLKLSPANRLVKIKIRRLERRLLEKDRGL